MNCAEAVNSSDILWKSFENRTLTARRMPNSLHASPGECNHWCETRRSYAAAKQMRLGASHPEPHRSWISRLAFPPLRTPGRRYRSDNAHTINERHIYRHCCRCVIRRITRPQPLRWPAAQPSSKSGKWRRPQCPGTGTRPRAFPIFPRQFTLENCRSATGFAAIVVRQAWEVSRIR
jgi:hypothetical protein